jgi:hypothetical protein
MWIQIKYIWIKITCKVEYKDYMLEIVHLILPGMQLIWYITNLVCYTYFHWLFNPDCQHIFGKQTGYIIPYYDIDSVKRKYFCFCQPPCYCFLGPKWGRPKTYIYTPSVFRIYADIHGWITNVPGKISFNSQVRFPLILR